MRHQQIKEYLYFKKKKNEGGHYLTFIQSFEFFTIKIDGVGHFLKSQAPHPPLGDK